MDERITDLEMKLTFLERTVEELNGVIIEQDKSIQALTKRVDVVSQQLEPSDETIQELPPHY